MAASDRRLDGKCKLSSLDRRLSFVTGAGLIVSGAIVLVGAVTTTLQNPERGWWS
jgi:hypothetical protein